MPIARGTAPPSPCLTFSNPLIPSAATLIPSSSLDNRQSSSNLWLALVPERRLRAPRRATPAVSPPVATERRPSDVAARGAASRQAIARRMARRGAPHARGCGGYARRLSGGASLPTWEMRAGARSVPMTDARDGGGERVRLRRANTVTRIWPV